MNKEVKYIIYFLIGIISYYFMNNYRKLVEGWAGARALRSIYTSRHFIPDTDNTSTSAALEASTVSFNFTGRTGESENLTCSSFDENNCSDDLPIYNASFTCSGIKCKPEECCTEDDGSLILIVISIFLISCCFLILFFFILWTKFNDDTKDFKNKEFKK